LQVDRKSGHAGERRGDSNNDWFMQTGNKTHTPSVWQHCKKSFAALG
jgi:hypothetical protein